MEQMEKVMVMIESMEMIKCSDLEKKKEKNKMDSRQRYKQKGHFAMPVKTL